MLIGADIYFLARNFRDFTVDIGRVCVTTVAEQKL